MYPSGILSRNMMGMLGTKPTNSFISQFTLRLEGGIRESETKNEICQLLGVYVSMYQCIKYCNAQLSIVCTSDTAGVEYL